MPANMSWDRNGFERRHGAVELQKQPEEYGYKLGAGCRFVMARSYPLCSGEIFPTFSMRWRCLRCYRQDSLLLLHCVCSWCSLATVSCTRICGSSYIGVSGWHGCTRYSPSFPADSGGTVWSCGKAWMSKLKTCSFDDSSEFSYKSQDVMLQWGCS